jgi:hypothetical protein
MYAVAIAEVRHGVVYNSRQVVQDFQGKRHNKRVRKHVTHGIVLWKDTLIVWLGVSCNGPG